MMEDYYLSGKQVRKPTYRTLGMHYQIPCHRNRTMASRKPILHQIVSMSPQAIVLQSRFAAAV